MNIFDVDKDGNLIILPESKAVPEVRALVTRDKGSAGDHDGRKKMRTIQEMLYIWHMNNIKSPYFNYKESDRHKRLAKDLFEDEQWKPDQKVLDLQKRYLEFNDSMAKRLLRSVIKKGDEYSTYLDVAPLNDDTVKIVMEVMEKVPKILDAVVRLEEKVNKEESLTDTKTKGNKKVSEFEE